MYQQTSNFQPSKNDSQTAGVSLEDQDKRSKLFVPMCENKEKENSQNVQMKDADELYQ